MFRTVAIIVSIAISAYSAEISSSYALMGKQAQFQPNLKTEPIKAKRETEAERHPVYNPEDHSNERRAKIEPVQPTGPVVKHDRMLADQPAVIADPSINVNQHEDRGYVYSPGPEEVAYPGIPYAPGYGYDNGYSASSRYENMYGNSPSPYYVEPDYSPFSLMWSQVPDARTLVSYVGRLVSWTFGSVFLLFLGSLLTIGVCSYTNICTIAYSGTIREEMRSLMTPEKLETISTAAKLVKTAIDTYQEKQNVANVEAVRRRRRAILH